MQTIQLLSTCAVLVLRYGAGIIRCAKDELKTLHRMTRNVLMTTGAFHTKCDVDRLYVSRDGVRGLISCEG